MYYLNSRYYDPEIGRFINADDLNYINEKLFNGINLFCYCGNNPVGRIDNNGNAWWHWLIAAALVVVAAVAVVVTAGGVAAGIAAISAVATGMSAGSLGTTIAAGAFIGLSTTFTAMTIVGGIEAIGSGSIADFWDYGETALIVTGTGGVLGSIGGYINYKYNNTIVGDHTPGKSTPYSTYINEKGQTVTHYDSNGNMWWSKHFSNHGRADKHPVVPHWHWENPHNSNFMGRLKFIIEFIKDIFRR